MCRLTTVSVSSQAAKKGSQCEVWMLGSLSRVGFSEKATANDPFAAQRRTSAAAATGSQSGMSVIGISRPRPAPAHHSSIIQSL